jgi:hypothetical protein
MLTPDEIEKAEQEADIGKLPPRDDNEVLMELAVGNYLDCKIVTVQQPYGRMESPLLHGFTMKIEANVKLVQGVPMKMWASTVLERIFEDKTLLARPVRIRRMSDQDFPGGRGKMYRVSDLQRVLALTAKDRATGA